MNKVDILTEYLRLGYKSESRDFELIDKMIDSTTLLRSTKEGDTIYYLTTGNSLFIPYGWLDLFSGLYFYDGNRILIHEPKKDEDYLESFIYEWMLYMKKVSLESLAKVCILGTDRFRDWIKENFGMKFYPIKIITEYNNIREV